MVDNETTSSQLPESTVTDVAGIECPWTTTTTTDPEVLKASVQRRDRAIRSSQGKTWTCPNCGRVLPASTIRGTTRKVCSNFKCRGRAWGDSTQGWMRDIRRRDSLTTGTPDRSRSLSPLQVQDIRSYPAGARATARALGVSPSQVQRIRRGESYQWVPDGSSN